MKNLKIGKKLLIAFLIIIIGLATVGVYGMYSINTITKADEGMYDNNLLGISTINDITVNFYLLRIGALKTVFTNQTPEGGVALETTIKEKGAAIEALFEEYQATVIDEEDQANLDSMKTTFASYITEVSKLVDLLKNGQNDQILAQLDVVNGQATSLAEEISTITEYNQTQGEATVKSNQGLGQTSNIILIVIAVAAGAVAVIFAFTVTRAITRPVNKLVDAANKLAEGNTDFEIAIDTKDEVGILAGAFEKMVASINKLIADANMLAGAAVAGALSTRADATQHQGDYRKIVEGVNSTLDAVIGPLNVAANYVDRISKGDIPEKITDSYNGDFNGIKNNLNTCIDAVNALVADANMLAQAAVDGKLSTRADATKHGGDFGKIVAGVNNTLDAVINPITEATGVLNEMAKGNLDVSMEGDYKGDHAIIKNAMNETIHNVKGYISEISAILGQMAQGDLRESITSEYKGNFVALKDSINSIAASLNELLSEINTASEQVSLGAQQVSNGNQAISQGATEQASSIEELSATVTQIAAQTRENAENSRRSNEMAMEAKLAAAQGNDQMKEMLKSMEEINESSENISKIIKVIDDIAFQTNMLALNAAVEAARAGVHGKGFAVVAEEVRNLAARSAKAAKETAELIEGSMKKVGAGTKIANETADALVRIVDGVDKTVQLGEMIAVASNEQAAGINQVNQGIEQMSQVVQTNSATSQEGAAASEELSGQAELLKEKIGMFKLKKSGSYSAAKEKKALKEAFIPEIELGFLDNASKY